MDLKHAPVLRAVLHVAGRDSPHESHLHSHKPQTQPMFEAKLRKWSAIYQRLQSAREQLRRAVDLRSLAEVQRLREEVSALQAESDTALSGLAPLKATR